MKIHGHAAQQPGLPDLKVEHPRWSGWIELKYGRGKLSMLQEIVIKDIRRAGGKVAVIRWDDGIKIDSCDEVESLIQVLAQGGTELKICPPTA